MTVHLCVDPPEMILLHSLSVICMMKTIWDFSQIKRKITIMLNMCFSYYIPSAVLIPTSPNCHPLSSPWKFYFLFIIILSPSFSLFFPFFIFFLIYLQKSCFSFAFLLCFCIFCYQGSPYSAGNRLHAFFSLCIWLVSAIVTNDFLP